MKIHKKTRNKVNLIHNPFVDKPNLKLVVYDIESYPNYFLCKFLTNSGQYVSYTGDQLRTLAWKLNDSELVLIGFNNNWYDDLMLKFIIFHPEANTQNLFELTETLINMGNEKTQLFWNIWKLPVSWYRSIDVYKLPNPQGGLKERSCGLHAPTIKDLPIKPGTVLTEEQKVEIFDYCSNDLQSTLKIYNTVIGDIDDRLHLESMYPGTNLISKHDAGVCEEIMINEYCKRNGMKKWELKKLIPRPGKKIHLIDCIPKCLTMYEQKKFIDLLTFVKKTSGVFTTLEQKQAIGYEFTFDNIVYNFGAGGLHSKDKSGILEPDKNHILLEIDVDSFYLGLIHNEQIKPTHMNHVYNDIIREQTLWRLEAKYNGDKRRAKALKPPLLSAFGKTGSEYSVMFDELAQLKITIGGQLLLFLLIELLYMNDIHIKSANTDGLFLNIKKSNLEKLRIVYRQWEELTNLKLSEEFFKSYIRRDVNNYLAIDLNGNTVKEKGVFKKTIKGKASIISKSIKNYLNQGISIEKTIRECLDIREFIFYFHCKKGFWMKHKINSSIINLQSTTRWYISKNQTGVIIKFSTMTESQQNKWKATHKLDIHPNDWIKTEHIANGTNSVIIDTLPENLPNDINFEYYINEANKILQSVLPKPKLKIKRKIRKQK